MHIAGKREMHTYIVTAGTDLISRLYFREKNELVQAKAVCIYSLTVPIDQSLLSQYRLHFSLLLIAQSP